METKEATFNPNDLSLGQLEFISEYTGRSTDEILEVFEKRDYHGKDLIAVVALVLNPEDPQSAVEEARSFKPADIQMTFGDLESEASEDN